MKYKWPINISLAIRKMQVKTTLSSTSPQSEWGVVEDIEKTELSLTADGKVN
jgi:hypothetical protein